MVEEANRPEIREIPFDRYRIMYRYDGKVVEILRVWPAAKPFRAGRMEGG